MRSFQRIRTGSQLSLTLGLVIAGTIVLACVDSPTKPTTPSLSATTSRSALTEVRGVATPLIDDASGRLASAIEEAVARDQLRSLLNQLSSALDKADERKARDRISQLRKLIESRASAPDAADLATIGLALDHIESQLNNATQSEK